MNVLSFIYISYRTPTLYHLYMQVSTHCESAKVLSILSHKYMQLLCSLISLCTCSKFVIFRCYLLIIYIFTWQLNFLTPPCQKIHCLCPWWILFFLFFFLGTSLTLFFRAELYPHPPHIHFQYSLIPSPHGCLTSPRGGVPTPLKYSAADARLTHSVGLS